ncbi:hypothetical protein [Amphritea pacifica]|uniref:Uncharacterized protein n=1 Tax=Amphritea pacifica TaxID=2811233 RepID=A0ABS2WE26_9GAMM|nr:hypothetical protein [Amphritea pacifica]MBN0989880.1 hypothetical protein [Amphritea pacifica]
MALICCDLEYACPFIALKYTDPSGYFSLNPLKHLKRLHDAAWDLVKGGLKAIASVPILNAIAQAAACFYGGPAGCAAYASATTYAVTGDMGLAVKSGLVSLVSSYISVPGTEITIGNVLQQGVVGGIMAEVQGGEFRKGFASGAFSVATSGIAKWGKNLTDVSGRVLVQAGLSGTPSVLGGGKFANGAAGGVMSGYLAGDYDPSICGIDSNGKKIFYPNGYSFSKETNDKFNMMLADNNDWNWRGGVLGFTGGYTVTVFDVLVFGISGTGAIGTDGRTINTLNIDWGVGTPGQEVYVRGFVGVNNTIDDLTGTSLAGSISRSGKSLGYTLPTYENSEGDIDWRAPLLEAGFSSSRGGSSSLTAAQSTMVSQDRWY